MLLVRTPMEMRIVGVALVASMVVAGAVLVRGRSSRPPEGEIAMPPPKRGNTIGGFSESLFKFAPTRRDKAEGQPNDWQEASLSLSFTPTGGASQGSWSCNLVVGMPLRTEKWGEITPGYAAYAAANAATDAATTVMPKNTDWTPAEFCKQWRGEIQAAFNGIEGLGAQASGSE